MRLGSLCTGYGGLDTAAHTVLPITSTVFAADNDPHVASWLGQRMADTPNLGDFTALDTLPDCDVLTAGFPCQPVSQAGKRAGTLDERWLWDDIERLLGTMGRPPSWLLLENVRGLLTANGGDAMGRVIRGLARLGYVGSYRVVSASDVGACHRRARVFIAASHPDGVAGTQTISRGRGRRTVEHTGQVAGTVRPDSGDDAHLPTPKARDWKDTGKVTRRPAWGIPLAHAVAALPAPTARGWKDGTPSNVPINALLGRAVWELADTFGPYADAVARWEQIIGRPAPNPTEPANSGGRRLSPVFVEWMMGLPEGWVTDPTLNLPLTQQLRMLGNGVVPQQAEAAYRSLLCPADD